MQISKVSRINPKTKQKGFAAQVVTKKRITFERLAKEMCKGTTLDEAEALMSARLFLKTVREKVQEGYIVEIGELGSLQPSCSSGWVATKDELTKDMVKPSVFYRASDEITSAIKGAKLAWVELEDEESESGTPDSGEGGDDDNTEL
jgi:nucleoid DNA-binding protein